MHLIPAKPADLWIFGQPSLHCVFKASQGYREIPCLKNKQLVWVVLAHDFNSSIPEFRASLVYQVSSRISRTTQKNCVSKNKTNKNNNKQTNSLRDIMQLRVCAVFNNTILVSSSGEHPRGVAETCKFLATSGVPSWTTHKQVFHAQRWDFSLVTHCFQQARCAHLCSTGLTWGNQQLFGGIWYTQPRREATSGIVNTVKSHGLGCHRPQTRT